MGLRRRAVAALVDPPERLLGLLLAEGVEDFGGGGDALADEAASEGVGGRGGRGSGGAERGKGGGGFHGGRRRRTPANFGRDDF